jgi:hypothetical protein
MLPILKGGPKMPAIADDLWFDREKEIATK